VTGVTQRVASVIRFIVPSDGPGQGWWWQTDDGRSDLRSGSIDRRAAVDSVRIEVP